MESLYLQGLSRARSPKSAKKCQTCASIFFQDSTRNDLHQVLPYCSEVEKIPARSGQVSVALVDVLLFRLVEVVFLALESDEGSDFASCHSLQYC